MGKGHGSPGISTRSKSLSPKGGIDKKRKTGEEVPMDEESASGEKVDSHKSTNDNDPNKFTQGDKVNTASNNGNANSPNRNGKQGNNPSNGKKKQSAYNRKQSLSPKYKGSRKETTSGENDPEDIGSIDSQSNNGDKAVTDIKIRDGNDKAVGFENSHQKMI